MLIEKYKYVEVFFYDLTLWDVKCSCVIKFHYRHITRLAICLLFTGLSSKLWTIQANVIKAQKCQNQWKIRNILNFFCQNIWPASLHMTNTKIYFVEKSFLDDIKITLSMDCHMILLMDLMF